MGGVPFDTPQGTVEASSVNKIKLYPGGTYQAGYSYSSAKSSNKSVVKASKDGTITAIKSGTATVTFKTSYGYVEKYKVTVKAYVCPVTFYPGYTLPKENKSSATTSRTGYYDEDDDYYYDSYYDDDYYYTSDNGTQNEIIMEVLNNTPQTFESLTVDYNICNKSGKTLESGTATLSGVVSKRRSYVSIYLPSKIKSAEYDLSKCTAEIKGSTFYSDVKYIDKSDSVSTSISDEGSSYYGNSEAWTVKVKNKTSKYVYGSVYVLLLDEKDKIVGVKRDELYLSGKEKSTSSFSIDREKYPGYDHRRIVPVVYCTK